MRASALPARRVRAPSRANASAARTECALSFANFSVQWTLHTDARFVKDMRVTRKASLRVFN